MGVLTPQPKTRQRALLAEWGIALSMVFEDGITEEGLIVRYEAAPKGWEMSKMTCEVGEFVRKTLAYPTREHQERMLKAKAEDWAEYVSSLNIVDPFGWLSDTPPNGGSVPE